ncbi:unnamed protein product [Mycena citricolor]|uniref:F-box domain-containing protein n=1 Tax=Mycena citricolor TaxID=2018698 RepID=A0AAD2GRK1_9AGAR|nr:unnamed protein product [Mycena citricolor]
MSHVSTFFQWNALPVEISLMILGLLDPYDILACRMASRSMWMLSNQLSLWTECLRNLDGHGFYPHSSESPSLSELERTATAGQRFTRRFQRHISHDHFGPFPALKRLYIEPADPEEELEHLRMVPGGRFLLTTHDCIVRLWDLTKPSSGPVSSLEIEPASFLISVWVRLSPPPNHDPLVIVASQEADLFHIHILTIKPEGQLVVEHPILALSIPTSEFAWIICATARLVAIQLGHKLIVWDNQRDLWMSWDLSSLQVPKTSQRTAYVFDGNIAIFNPDESELTTSRIPSLEPRASTATHPPLLKVAPDILQRYTLYRFNSLQRLTNSPFAGVTLVFHSPETSTRERPVRVDVVSSDENENVILSYFVLIAETDGSHPKLVAVGESQLAAWFDLCHSFHLEWISCDTVQCFIIESTVLHVVISQVSFPDDSLLHRSYHSVAGVLGTAGSILAGDANVDFCSLSGRICARTKVAEGEGYRVAVLDYVL